jgi:hypothetical protein
MSDKILTAQDVQGEGVVEFTVRVLRRRWNNHPIPVGFAEGIQVEAEINQGRWIVPCPFCTGAEMLDMKDLRFFCLSCYNKAVGGKWIKVAVPKEKEVKGVERELLRREVVNQNWTAKESIEGLRKENLRMEVK